MGLEIDIRNNEFLKRVYDKGRAEGEEKGCAEMLLMLLERRFATSVPQALRDRIKAASEDQITVWFTTALDADDLDTVFGRTAH